MTSMAQRVCHAPAPSPVGAHDGGEPLRSEDSLDRTAGGDYRSHAQKT